MICFLITNVHVMSNLEKIAFDLETPCWGPLVAILDFGNCTFNCNGSRYQDCLLRPLKINIVIFVGCSYLPIEEKIHVVFDLQNIFLLLYFFINYFANAFRIIYLQNK